MRSISIPRSCHFHHRAFHLHLAWVSINHGWSVHSSTPFSHTGKRGSLVPCSVPSWNEFRSVYLPDLLLPPHKKAFMRTQSPLDSFKNLFWEHHNLKVNKKMWRDTSQDIWMAKKHIKRCCTSLVLREVQIKTTVKYHHTPTRVTKVKMTDESWWGLRATGTLIHCWRQYKMV